MNVTLYTINDAESDFCKQAKDFLNSHNIPFENKDVEHDRAALSAMLAVSENFSGVPVMVVGEGADQKVVKGFTAEEYEVALGLAPVQTAPAQAPMAAPMPAETVAPTEPVAPAAPVEPVAPVEPTAPVEPVMPSVASEPVTPAAPPLTTPEASHDDELKGIMDALAQNGMPSDAAAAPVAPAEPAPALEVPVDEHPVNPVMDTADTEPQTPEKVTAPAEFTASAQATQEPVTPSVTEPSTWANQPASTMPAAPSAPAAPAWNSQPAAPVAPAAPAEPTAPMTDMPSVPDFPQK